MTSMLFTERMRSAATTGAAAGALFMTHPRFPGSNTIEGAAPVTEWPPPQLISCDRTRDLRRLVASLGPLRPAGILFGVVLGGGVGERDHFVGDRLDVVGRLVPLRAVPLNHEHLIVTVMVLARDPRDGSEA